MDAKKFKQAFDLHKKNQFKKALNIYRALLLNCKNDTNLLFLIATLYLQLKNYSQAIYYFKELLKLEPHHFHALSNLGICYLETNEFDLSEKCLNDSILANPEFPHSHNSLGNLFYKLNRYDSAITAYSKAIEINPQSEFFFNRAKSYVKINSLYLAEEDILNIAPSFKSLELDILNTQILAKQNNYQGILKLFNTFDNNSKSHNYIQATHVAALINLYQFDNILHLIDQLKSENDRCFYTALYFFKHNKFDDATYHFKKIINVPDYDYLVLNNLGLIEKAKKNFTKALDYFNQSINILPSYSEAKVNISVLNLYHKNFLDGFPLYFSREKKKSELITKNLFEYHDDVLPDHKTLVIAEQGIGDHIFYLQLLKIDFSFKFDFFIDPRLIHLYSNFHKNINFYDINSNAINFSKYDSYIFIADLFKYFIKDEKDIYLFQKKYKLSKKIISPPAHLPIIGISWKTFSKDKPDPTKETKSIQLSKLMKILKSNLGIFRLVNLQYGDVQSDIDSLNPEDQALFIDHQINLKDDITSLFYLINQCNFILTIGNITAHIAGTLGIQSLVLIPEHIDRIFYWHDDYTNIWYKNMNVLFFDHSRLELQLTNFFKRHHLK